MINALQSKITVVILILFGMISVSEAQQLPIYNQFKYNQFVYNPALSGVDTEVPVLTLLHRNQWTGIDGAPETSLVSFNGVGTERNVGYAAYMYHDKTGILSTTSFYGNYSFTFTVLEDLNISLGLSAGVITKGIDKSEIVVHNNTDDIYSTNTSGSTVFDFNAGINLSYWNFDLGFAAPQLFENSIDYAKELEESQVVFGLERHYVASLRYTYGFEMKMLGDFGNDMSVIPQVITRISPNSDIQFDAHVLLDLPKIGWIGGGYRSEIGPIANIGFNITSDLSLGYAYEFNTSELSNNLGSTHELALIYKFGGNKRIMDKVQRDLDEVKEEEIKLMEEMEKRMIRRQDSLSEAFRSDIVINANQIIDHDDQLQPEIDSTEFNIETQTYEKEDHLQSSASNIIAGSKGFYIVANVFSEKKNAEKMTNRLYNEGYDVEYFFNKANRFYYVFLRKYKSLEQAMEVRNSGLDGTYFDELWVKEIK